MNRKRIALAFLLACCLPIAGCVALVAGGAAAGGYYVGKDDRTVGEIADDAAITTKVKAKLIAAKDIKSLNINVDTRYQVVTLNGKVRSNDEARRAVHIAEEVGGVKRVISKLKIVKVPVQDDSA